MPQPTCGKRSPTPVPPGNTATPLKYKFWQLHSEHYVTVRWACVGVRWEGAEMWSSGTHASYQRRCWGGHPESMGGSQSDLLSRLSHLHPHGSACLSGSKETSPECTLRASNSSVLHQTGPGTGSLRKASNLGLPSTCSVQFLLLSPPLSSRYSYSRILALEKGTAQE